MCNYSGPPLIGSPIGNGNYELLVRGLIIHGLSTMGALGGGGDSSMKCLEVCVGGLKTDPF